METLFLGIVFLIISYGGYSLDKRVLNPLFIVPSLWGSFLVLYQILPHHLYPLQGQFLIGIVVWVISFFIGGLFFFRKNINFEIDLFNPKIFNIYYYIILIGAPLSIVLILFEAINSDTEVAFLIKLRLINMGEIKINPIFFKFFGYVFNFTNIVCLLFTLYYERVSKRRYYTILFLMVLLGLITLARTHLIVLVISIFVIFYLKGKLTRKHYIRFVGLGLLGLAVVTFLREFSSANSFNFSELLAIYLFSGMTAFDRLSDGTSEVIGGNVFRFFYAVINTLGVNVPVNNTILDYSHVPTPTNVYTVLYPFYKDFGYFGIAFFGILYGVGCIVIYNGFKRKNLIFVLIYSLLFPALLLQFLNEYILTNLSTYLQMMIVLIPFYLIKKL